MNNIDQYLQAATRENTQRSYASAVRHFEVEWGGFLPAIPDSLARYLVDYAEQHSIHTLRQRLAALAQWHHEHGFPDPSKSPLVRKILKGIQVLHPVQVQQAAPLQIEQLMQVVHWLETELVRALAKANTTAQLRLCRDRALLLLGFWRGFRGDELLRLRIEHIELVPDEGMRCFLARSKGDRLGHGCIYSVPMLSRLCPVRAYRAWIELSGLTGGPVFRRIDRWGQVAATGIHANSLIPLLRKLFAQAGLSAPENFSSHSLRRGFAGWANTQGWDLKTLMEYVGWKDVKSAMRYIDGADPFARQRIEQGLSS